MLQPAASSSTPRRSSGGRFLLVLFLLAIAFAAGYVPQWLELRRLRATHATTSLQLRLATLHRELGVASHEAQRSNFASAGEAASRFFTGCAELASEEPFTDDERTKVALSSYAAQRDEVMALLAASDPAVRERLAGLYLTMNGVIGRRVAP
ncbi:MAG TPA: hypothetical protein VF266_00315 [Thermoanaerobaculia bacterium]